MIAGLVATCVLGCGDSPVTPPTPTGTVTVFAHEGTTAVPGVHAEILNTTLAGDTGADGKVSFTLEAGTHIVRVFTGNLFQAPYLDNRVTIVDDADLMVDLDLCWSCR